MISCSFLTGNSTPLFAKFAIALLIKTGNSWKSLHSIISKLSDYEPEANNDRKILNIASSYAIHEDDLWLAENLMERIFADGWQISFYRSDRYPKEWIPYGEKSPPMIFFRGVLTKEPTIWSAIVGTAHPDSITCNLVNNVIETLGKFDCGVATGGAPGVDTISTESAISKGIPVRIILPVGALHYAPTKTLLIASEKGLCQIISPWTPNSKWYKSQAVRRNPLIAYLSSVGFIFNPSHEGGSFRVARTLFSRNLPVFVHMPDKFAWHLRYSNLVYTISDDKQTLNIEIIEKIIKSLQDNSKQKINNPHLNLF